MNNGDIIIYQTDDGKTSLEVNLKEETVWLHQKQMAELFDKNYKTISKHINNIYREAELERKATVSYFETVQIEGGRKIARNIEYYNLDVIKVHPFTDGNKRIGAFLFIWFLDANNVLYGKDGRKRIADNALVALSLLIAESKPEEKDIIVKVIVNLINKKNW